MFIFLKLPIAILEYKCILIDERGDEMSKAVEQTEEMPMTDKQATRYELLARFYEIQTALDRITDSASRTILEEQKKELIERLATE